MIKNKIPKYKVSELTIDCSERIQEGRRIKIYTEDDILLTWYPVVTYNPFGNCQVMAIANFIYIANIINIKNKTEVLAFLSKVRKSCGYYKPYTIVDIQRHIYDEISSKLPILGKFEYRSRTGSNMVTLTIGKK